MKKLLIAAVAATALFATMPQPAHAFFGGEGQYFSFKKFKKFKYYKHVKKPPVAPKQEAHLGRQSHGWVPQYIFAATTCSALFLWIEALHTSQTQHRELTQKEAWTTVGNCFLPFIGGEIMGRLAQQP